jgi:hypothetical protein
MSTVPTGLQGNCKYRQPRVERGANIRCAYGAGDEEVAGIVRLCTDSLERPPTIKPPALSGDTYFFSIERGMGLKRFASR